jgi:hypothetical protein
MIARVGASLVLIAAISMGCGKYGPPVRVQSDEESRDRSGAVGRADGGDSSEEDSDRKERQP